ncbi:MAG: universal stress protein [Micromonosporaceae bacterium]|nr:universal stress protein [Micromonosporaceae bacterium]
MQAQPAARVVVGVADSMAGLEALRVAVDEARRRGVKLYAVRAWRLPGNWPGAQMRQWSQEMVAEETARLNEAFAMAMGGVPAEVPVELIVAEGVPGPTLVSQAIGEDDLIVVGTPTRGRGWSVTGVAQYCRRHAGCPVLVVPPPSMARLGRPRALARRLRRSLSHEIRI